jgi:hypothetical protein
MRPLILLMILVSGMLCGTSAWSARSQLQASCEAMSSGEMFTLTSRDAGYTVNNNLSYKLLTRLKGPDTARGYVLGLTRTESRIEIGLSAQILSDAHYERECIVPHIDVTLSYVPIIIYVGSEFPSGSCAYQEILAHEMRHLNAYLNHLPKVETLVRAALKQRFAAKPIYAPAGQGKAMLERELDAGWMPFIKKEMGKVEQIQAAIDSTQEYKRLSKVCEGEVQLLIGSPKRNRK